MTIKDIKTNYQEWVDRTPSVVRFSTYWVAMLLLAVIIYSPIISLLAIGISGSIVTLFIVCVYYFD